MSEESKNDVVKEARGILAKASRIHALNDSDPSADEDVGWMLSALSDEVERHRAIMEGRIDRESILKYLGYTEGGALTIGVQPPEFVRRILALLFVEAMGDAENFQTGSFTWKAQDYEMTIRRIDGKSTAQVLGELRAEVEQLKSLNSVQTENIEHMQSQLRVMKEAIEAAMKFLRGWFGKPENFPALEQLVAQLENAITPKGQNSERDILCRF